MKQKFFAIMLITLFGVSAAMAGHHGMRAPRGPMAPDAPRGFCGMERGRHFQGPGRLLQLADKLDLTDQQVAEIKEKMEKSGLERIDKQAELKKAKLKLRHLKMNDAPDNEILSAIEKVGKLQTEMRKQRFMHRSQMKDILTEAQQEKLKELRQEFRGNRRAGCKGYRSHGYGYYFEDETETAIYGMESPESSGEWDY